MRRSRGSNERLGAVVKKRGTGHMGAQGCHEMQGFHFSGAIPAQAFREKLEAER